MAEKFKLKKLDIEGMEYEVINSIIESGNLPDVLCVDFDEAKEKGSNAYVEFRC
ncbi:MAG: hypothetical protein IJE43_08945 [Alphaproteobacteria bacterium]|nr:hypothetical protein [Alphaproteobacteria bacterium]MBQ6888579.1 hypothetical protein [Lachnospiraceae bacterium]